MNRLDELGKFGLLGGLILMLVFGSSHLVLEIRDYHENVIQSKLEAIEDFVFVSLDRAQRIPTGGKNHYYFSYSGKYLNRDFVTLEEVTPDYFHRHSEGKNVEAKILMDPMGIIHTRLRKNLKGNQSFDSIRSFTMGGFYLGIVSGLPSLFLLVFNRSGKRNVSSTNQIPGRG